MAGEVENTGGIAPKTRKTALNREEQDRNITAESAGALALMDGVQGDAEIAAILAAKGYPAGRFAEGRALQATLQSAITARQSALGAKVAGAAALESADAAARERYADFRGTARPVFTTAADRTALNLNGNVSRTRSQFITAARTSYNNAKSASYLNVLTGYGETAATLDAALAGLAAL